MAYEATQLVLSALAQVGPQRPQLISALHQIKFRGFMGPIAFDDKGDILNGAVTVTRADAKRRRFVVLP
jgi:branched-chain amino acid transport system substrate-binding protein